MSRRTLGAGSTAPSRVGLGVGPAPRNQSQKQATGFTLNLGKKQTAKSVLDLLEDNTDISQVDDVIYFRFKVNEGKGSGMQLVPVTELAEFIARLEYLSVHGPATDEAGYTPSFEMLERTFQVEYPDDSEDPETAVVSWNSRGGKGAKPARVFLRDLPAVVRFPKDRAHAGLSQLIEEGYATREQLGLSDEEIENAPDVNTLPDPDGASQMGGAVGTSAEERVADGRDQPGNDRSGLGDGNVDGVGRISRSDNSDESDAALDDLTGEQG